MREIDLHVADEDKYVLLHFHFCSFLRRSIARRRQNRYIVSQDARVSVLLSLRELSVCCPLSLFTLRSMIYCFELWQNNPFSSANVFCVHHFVSWSAAIFLNTELHVSCLTHVAGLREKAETCSLSFHFAVSSKKRMNDDFHGTNFTQLIRLESKTYGLKIDSLCHSLQQKVLPMLNIKPHLSRRLRGKIFCLCKAQRQRKRCSIMRNISRRLPGSSMLRCVELACFNEGTTMRSFSRILSNMCKFVVLWVWLQQTSKFFIIHFAKHNICQGDTGRCGSWARGCVA